MTFTLRCSSKDELRREARQLGALWVQLPRRRDGPRACGASWQFTTVRLADVWRALGGSPAPRPAAVLGSDL